MIVTLGNKNLLVDFAANRITFLDSRFYLSPKGIYVPSVTTYCEAYPNGYGYYDWLKTVGHDADQIRDEAGRKGSVVHGLTESYDKGETVSVFNPEGEIQYKLSEWAMFERYVEFKEKFQPEILRTEFNVVSDTLKTGGTLDRTIKLNGAKILIDIKTGGGIWPSYWCQLAAYRELLRVEHGEEVDAVGILWLNAKTRTDGRAGSVQGKGWQLVCIIDTAIWWKRFLACKELWLAEHEDEKPKELIYSIKHKIKKNGSS